MRSIPVLFLLAALAGCGAPAGQTDLGSAASNIRVADAAISSGSLEVALQVLQGILKTDPANTDALTRQAKVQFAIGNVNAAEVSYRRALAVKPDLAEARIGLGKVAMRTNPAEAERIFLAVLKDAPRNVHVLNNLGVARDLQGHHADAQKAYRQVLEISPGLPSAQQNLALSLAVSGRAPEGVAMLNRLAQSGEGGRKVRDNLGLALAIAGQTTEAGQVLSESMSQADVARAIAAYRTLAEPAGAAPDAAPLADPAP
jgi:Flp pilus assembly protein TadD